MKFKRFSAEVVRSRHLIYYLTLGFGIIFLIYALITPKKYRSEGLILPELDVSGILELSGMFGEASGGKESRMLRIAKTAGFSMGYSSGDVIGALLKSRTVMEAVVSDCDLFSTYNINKNSMEKALKQLDALTEVEITKEDIVKIQCDAKTPTLAAKMVNSYLDNLDRFLREKGMSKGKNMRMFIEKRLADAEIELQTAAESLRIYQEQNKIVMPNEEISAALDAYAMLKGRLFAKEIEAGVIDRYSNKDAPFYYESRVETEVIRKKLREMETKGFLTEGFGAGFGISFSKIPKVMQEYYKRYLDLKIQEEVYGFLKQQYEQARILEIKDTPVITVLDWGRMPERKHSPKTTRLVALGLIIGFFFGLVRCQWVIFIEDLFRNKERKKLFFEFKNAIGSDIRNFLHLFKRRKTH